MSKNAIIDLRILRLPTIDLPNSIDTDAFVYQIGVALMQTQEDENLYPIDCWGRSLNSAEQNYSVTGRECLAVVWSCQMLRPYFIGNKIQN